MYLFFKCLIFCVLSEHFLYQIITDRMARVAVLDTLVLSQGIQVWETAGVLAETGLIEVE